MKNKTLSFQEFTFSICWLCFFLFGSISSAQTPEADPKEEPPFSVIYHVLPNVSGSYENYAYAINQEGKIAGGTSFAENGFSPIGVIWWPTGEGDAGYSPTYASGPSYDINDKGKIVPGAEYGPSYGLPNSETDTGGGAGIAINNSDEVVGTGWETRQKEGPLVVDASGESYHNLWFEVRTQTYPAKVLPEIATKLGGAHKSTDVLIIHDDGTQTIKTPRHAGIAWSIDEKGYCVGVDVNGIAVWNYKTGYRRVPAGAEKRLISISPEGVVCGTTEAGPTFWPRHGEDSSTVLPLPENAGNGDHFATAFSDTGWVVGQVNGRIYTKEDHQWKGGKAYAWKKEGVDENGKPTWTMMDLSKYAPEGWRNLTILDVNRSGKAVGFAEVNGKYCAIMVELGPQLIAIDANRDGITRFEDDPKVLKDPEKFSDLTTAEKPFRYWLNDDLDTDKNVEKLKGNKVNFNDNTINSVRDLEDFYRLKIRIESDWEAKFGEGYTLEIETTENLKINLFRTAYIASNSKLETEYLSNLDVAISQNAGRLTYKIDEKNIQDTLKKRDYESKSILLLWEGAQLGKGKIVLTLRNKDKKKVATSFVYLNLYPINEFFERVEVKSREKFLPPYLAEKGYVPQIFYQVTDRENVDIFKGEVSKTAVVFVHGWRLNRETSINWAQTFYKRLWHAGYKGRFYSFCWFTYSGDEEKLDGLFTYNKSEHRAWNASSALLNYIAEKRSEIPGDYSLNVTAHSMGNIIAGEAIKKGAKIDKYVMQQAAVPACAYDTRQEIYDPTLSFTESKNNTPQLEDEMGYIGRFSKNSVPTFNLYNEDDFALSTYILDQRYDKPDKISDKDYPIEKDHYQFIENTPGIFRENRISGLVRKVSAPYESLAFIARSQTFAVGAEPRTCNQVGTFFGPIKGGVNLKARFDFGGGKEDHSGQFNRSIQENLLPFYNQLRFFLVEGN